MDGTEHQTTFRCVENYDTIANDTITAFVKALKTHRPFYEENIKGGEPFVWIPMLNSNSQRAQELWWGEDFVENMTDDFLAQNRQIIHGYWSRLHHVNPEANRIITHFLSDNFTDYFETVADTADWNYPEWYLDGSPL